MKPKDGGAARMTDESVAKALGWKKDTDGLWLDADGLFEELPCFTICIDDITDAIEARGLAWRCRMLNGSKDYLAEVGVSLSHGDAGFCKPTAPLALCAALLAYLKEVQS